jgi:hypothetical protein
MSVMHALDLVDETFIAAPPTALAAAVADPSRWRLWWPDRTLEVFLDRGIKGQRWSVAGDLVGSAEIWLEAFRDGVLLHYYLRADPAGDPGRLTPRAVDRIRRAEAVRWKKSAWALKTEYETERIAAVMGR